jgi:hypothetical protein
VFDGRLTGDLLPICVTASAFQGSGAPSRRWPLDMFL